MITWNYSYSQGHMDYLEGNYARNRTVGGARPKVATVEGTMAIRVSQKKLKVFFWNVLYPSGFHRLDEPPEKISAL